MALAVSSSEHGTVLDQLDTPLVFNGFGAGTPAPSPTPTPGSTTAPTPSHPAPSVSGFSRTAKVKQSKATGTVTAHCGLPATEVCVFSLTLYATLKHGHATSRVT